MKKDVEIGLTESLCCTAEVNTVASINYSAVEKKRQTPRRRVSPFRRFRLWSGTYSLR